MEIHLKIFDSRDELSQALTEEMTFALFDGGSACLAGGSSPLQAYSLLARKCILPWERITLIPSDERCLPPGHDERNDTLLQRIFQKHQCKILNLTSEEDFTVRSPLLDKNLPRYLPFRVTILGLGEDGHTAGLFPGNPSLQAVSSLVEVSNSPKPPRERVSLSIKSLNRSEKIFFCVIGSSKRSALHSFLDGSDIPPSLMSPEGEVMIFADREAAGSNT
ncbi:MAG: 6-phosphogluconolactonase [Synergistales bacterium]|nr:6-phosphogluconolactonase [Synergistales bacterium]